MRIALLSDVHANEHALEAALDHLARNDIDRYLCAGDLVGYGVHPNECVDRLVALGALCVAGNHDLMAVGRLPLVGCGRLVERTLPWTQNVLEPEVQAFLTNLLTVIRGSGTVITHGALGSGTTYITQHRQAREQLTALAAQDPSAEFLVFGHTHSPFAFARRNGGLLPRSRSSTTSVYLPPDEAVLLNPGSVGQSRERAPVARFVVLDLETRQATFHALRYDLRSCRRDLKQWGFLPQRAIDRHRACGRSAYGCAVFRLCDGSNL